MKFKNLWSHSDAVHRLRHGYYYRTGAWGDYNMETDRLVVFTTSEMAMAESEHNLRHFLVLGRKYESKFVIVNENGVQFVGQRLEITVDRFVTVKMMADYKDWRALENDKYSSNRTFKTDLSQSHFKNDDLTLRADTFRMWSHPFALKEQFGFYDVATGQQITKRREQIEKLWELGFVSRRGRPITAAHPMDCIAKSEIPTLIRILQDIDRKHQAGHQRNEFHHSMYLLYRRIMRRCCWPGFW